MMGKKRTIAVGPFAVVLAVVAVVWPTHRRPEPLPPQ
jgi:hypothetical protein